MEKGALDALYSVYIPTIFRNGSPSIARLWPNFREVETEYFRRTGIFPVMHLVVIREDVHRAHPRSRRSIYRAFCEARDHALEALPDSDALHVALPFLLDHVEENVAHLRQALLGVRHRAEPSRLRSDGPLPLRAGPRAARGHAGGDVSKCE